MAAYLRPRRGTSSNNNIVLKEGELYLDTSNSNNTSNSWGRIYIGDNSTTISNLKPFIDYPENMIIHSGISSSGSESSISNGNTLSTIISAIKNVLSTKSSVIKISESDYNNLSTSEKNDPNKVYFRYEASSIWQNYLLLSGGTMTGTLTSPGINMTGNIITPANDNYGIEPATANYGQVGSESKPFYRMHSYRYKVCNNFGAIWYGSIEAELSGTRTWNMPDASGTVALQEWTKSNAVGQNINGNTFSTLRAALVSSSIPRGVTMLNCQSYSDNPWGSGIVATAIICKFADSGAYSFIWVITASGLYTAGTGSSVPATLTWTRKIT